MTMKRIADCLPADLQMRIEKLRAGQPNAAEEGNRRAGPIHAAREGNAARNVICMKEWKAKHRRRPRDQRRQTGKP